MGTGKCSSQAIDTPGVAAEDGFPLKLRTVTDTGTAELKRLLIRLPIR
jgi:hypothetical protein